MNNVDYVDNYTKSANDIIEYISKDKSIVSILGENAFYPLFTTVTDKTTVTYNLIPSKIGIINEATLNLKVISPTDQEALRVISYLEKLLVMTNSIYKKYKSAYFYSEYSSGGRLFNPEYRMYEQSLSFNLKWRCL